MSRTTADFIADYVTHKPASLICLPSGESPTGTLHYLVRYALEGKVDFSQCFFLGLDEWVGVDEHKEGTTSHYLFSHFFSRMNLKKENLILFDSRPSDLDEECNRINKFINEKGPIDILLAGIGMNGHIGLNEPGSDFSSYSHHIALDPVTKLSAPR